MFRIYFTNLAIAWEAILANSLRALLTALGIVFGVAAVIAMLAIGTGAQKEILEQIKLVGVNNIVITPIIPTDDNEAKQATEKVGQAKKKKLSGGLTLADAENIAKIPTIKAVSPEVIVETTLIYQGQQRNSKLIGVTPSYFQFLNFELDKGANFSKEHLDNSEQVCIIGRGIQTKLFSGQNPIGKSIKCGKHWLKIIGVLKGRQVSSTSLTNLGIRDYDMDVYAPVRTLLTRYRNRNLLTKAAIQRANNQREENPQDKKTPEKERKNYHQIDRLVVQVRETDQLMQSGEIVSRMLKRRHLDLVDYEIIIPEEMLKQQQRTKNIFNYVLGAIAGISLLVGGIGIMNIMLASVLERIKEIGLRLSLGAKKRDIVLQFMFEAILISVSGGVIGIILGVSLAYIVAEFIKIPTVISFSSIWLSFFVSATVGLVFGIVPARRAAQQDPITSLRYE